jgi:Na+/proline symporter
LLFLLRWFWWRINAYSEITAMGVSFLVALYFELLHQRLGYDPLEDWQQLTIGVGITTISWVLVTLATSPADQSVLRRFCRKVHPGGPGWRSVTDAARAEGEDPSKISGKGWEVPQGILNVTLGSVMIYSTLFMAGFWIYGNLIPAVITAVTASLSAFLLAKQFRG